MDFSNNTISIYEYNKLVTRMSKAEGENAFCLRYATKLLVSLVNKHFPENKDFMPFDTLEGVLTQIDNATCGLIDPKISD